MLIQFSPALPACLLSTLLAFQVAAAQTPDITREADKYLTIRSEMGSFSGAVLIAKKGKVIFRKGYGYADVEKRIPYTPETQHSVASISKMFTAIAALKLRDQGKLGLAHSICRYVDDCPDAWKPVTIDHLIHHTAGIPDYEAALELGSKVYLEYMTQAGSSERIVAKARTQPLEFKPGEKFNYTNTGYILLSYAIQRAAGMPFAEYVKTELLDPAGMTRSGIIGAGAPPASLAAGYTYGDLGWQKALAGVAYSDGHMEKLPTLPLAPPAGDAFLYSTVDDLYRWSQAMDGGIVAAPSVISEVFKPGIEGYGAGWFIGPGFNRTRYRHNGMLPGYVSDLIKFPDDSITIVIFSNIDRARISSIARDLTAMTLGEPYDMPVRGQVVELSPEQISRLTGDYLMADGGKLNVSMSDMLTAKLEGRFTAGLIPLSATEFYFPLGDGRAVFRLGSDGKAAEVNLRYSGVDRVAKRPAK